MQRISTLLQKLHELSKNEDKISAIELDLMLDYTRVLYADLLEWRNRVVFTTSLLEKKEEPATTTPIEESEIQPENTAPPIELTGNIEHYASTNNVETNAPHIKDRDIRKLIAINDKYQFISELFGNNKEAYEDVLNHINGATNYEQVTEWLDEHTHTTYNWDDDSFAVQSFYNTVNAFLAAR